MTDFPLKSSVAPQHGLAGPPAKPSHCSRSSTVTVAMLALCAMPLLGSCGQKGPLTLPAATQPATPAASAPSPAVPAPTARP